MHIAACLFDPVMVRPCHTRGNKYFEKKASVVEMLPPSFFLILALVMGASYETNYCF
jgi:hypothetical protein